MGGHEIVRVTNVTRMTILGERIRLARSTRDRTVGLLGTKSLASGSGLLIRSAPSIHMFFMRYPIDAVFLDRDLKVLKVVSDLQPWRIVWWVRGARDCLELPVGTISQTRTQPGDVIAVESVAP